MKALNHRTTAIAQEREKPVPRQLKPRKLMYICSYRREKFGWFSKRGKSSWAYYAVCGYSNYYRKFGIKISNPDANKLQNNVLASGSVVTEVKDKGSKNTKHGHRIIANDSCNPHMLQNSPDLLIKNACNAGISNSNQAMHHQSHHEFGSGHFSWFFMSVWNQPGMNPYAISIHSHPIEKAEVGKSGKHNPTITPKAPGIAISHMAMPVPVVSNQTSLREKSQSLKSHSSIGPAISFFEAANRNDAAIASNPLFSPMHAPHQANPGHGHKKSPFNPIQIPKPVPEKTELKINSSHPMASELIKSAPRTHTPRTKTLDPKLGPPDSGRSVYIPPKIPLKVIPKLVIGAEALPE